MMPVVLPPILLDACFSVCSSPACSATLLNNDKRGVKNDDLVAVSYCMTPVVSVTEKDKKNVLRIRVSHSDVNTEPGNSESFGQIQPDSTDKDFPSTQGKTLSSHRSRVTSAFCNLR